MIIHSDDQGAPIALARSGCDTGPEPALIADPVTLLGLTLCTSTRSKPDRRRSGDPHAEAATIGVIVDLFALGNDRYVLVDTRHSMLGSRRLLPVAAVDRIDLTHQQCFTALERQFIRDAPDFDPFHLAQRRYHNVMQNYFERCLGGRNEPPESHS